MDIAPTKPLAVLLHNLSADDSRRLSDNQLLQNLAKLDSITVLTVADTAPDNAAQLFDSRDNLGGSD